MIYIIDLREEHELKEIRYISLDPNIAIICSPARTIFANKEIIKEINKNDKVYLMCRSGNRSGKIKELYFKDDNNIISLENGLNDIERFNIDTIKEGGGYGMQQYMQFIFACIIIITIIGIYKDISKKYLIGGLLLFIIFILYQIFSKSCILSKIIPYKK